MEDRRLAADAHELGRAPVGVDIDIVDDDVVVLVRSILVEATTARQHLATTQGAPLHVASRMMESAWRHPAVMAAG